MELAEGALEDLPAGAGDGVAGGIGEVGEGGAAVEAVKGWGVNALDADPDSRAIDAAGGVADTHPVGGIGAEWWCGECAANRAWDWSASVAAQPLVPLVTERPGSGSRDDVERHGRARPNALIERLLSERDNTAVSYPKCTASCPRVYCKWYCFFNCEGLNIEIGQSIAERIPCITTILAAKNTSTWCSCVKNRGVAWINNKRINNGIC